MFHKFVSKISLLDHEKVIFAQIIFNNEKVSVIACHGNFHGFLF